MRMFLVLSCTLALAACQGGSGEEACEGPLGKPLSASELSAMPSCCQAEAGPAHCLDEARVPEELRGFVATCDGGGYCMPDSFLATGGAVPPATCTAFGGAGVCLSRCIPQVAENQGVLRQDVCPGADELCVPCVSPIDNMPTGACELLESARCVGEEGGGGSGSTAACDDPATCNYEASCPPVIDPTTLGAPCGTNAHCVDAALVPADQASNLAPCTDASKLCVPDVFIATGGKFTPATCNSVGGAEGRCVSTVIPQIAAQDALLPKDSCADGEKCAPCFDPIEGKPTGVCNLSCDTGPTREPVTFPACCENRAHCVPTSAIPDEAEGNLGEDNCASGNLCVPDQILLSQPIATCQASSFILGDYTGVCLSECFDFGIQGAALSRGTCSAEYVCAPCELDGEPTGAPGCPP